MKYLLSTLCVLLISISGMAQISFNTGSVEFDADLNIINKDAKSDIKLFKSDLSTAHNIGITKIEELLRMSMEPAEVFLAILLRDITKKPIDDVVNAYRLNKDKGWGQIAKSLGIKPGSPEFHALKGKTKTKGNSGKGKPQKGNSGKSKGKGKK